MSYDKTSDRRWPRKCSTWLYTNKAHQLGLDSQGAQLLWQSCRHFGCVKFSKFCYAVSVCLTRTCMLDRCAMHYSCFWATFLADTA